VKTWIVAVGTVIVVIGSAIGLWMTWDSTQTSASEPMGRPLDLTAGDEVPALTADVPHAPPTCTPSDVEAAEDPLNDWATVVVDPGHRLSSEFVPPDLVDVGDAGFESTGDLVRQLVVSDLAALREGAEASGTPFIIVSAYRSYEYQRNLYDEQVAEVGEDEAAARTALPGHSEHQLGTTIDVLDPAAGELTTEFANTPAGRWIAGHAHEYGFVLSYPNEARERTCYDFEPWHLRYVGLDIAQRIHSSGQTPREWMLSQDQSVG
jgi:zinc D-Ala-D-Ala carboxypeptidase